MRKKRKWMFLTAALCASVLFAVPVMASEKEDSVPEEAVTSVLFADQEDNLAEELSNGIQVDLSGKTTDKYYYINGVVQDITDVIKIDDAWYNLVNGKVVANSVEKNSYGWWYINEEGVVDFSYNGFAENSSGWWYVEGGRVDFNANGIKKGTVNGVSGWWYVRGGQVTFTDTVAKNEYGWWCIENGRVNFQCNSVEKNAYGWWKIQNGKVDFSYNGLASNENGYWYIKNGKVDFEKNDVLKATVDGVTGWWNVAGGKLTYGPTVAKNANGWWYIDQSGKVDFRYNGFAKNSSGWWYVKNGRVTFDVNDIKKGTVNGETGWWYIVKSQVVFTDTVAQNAYGWWCIEDGKVDFSCNSIEKNAYGWWKIKNGKVDFSCNSVEQNEYGWWYVRNGKVDFSYTGLAKNAYGWWRIEAGMVNFSYNGVVANEYGAWLVENGKVNFDFSGTKTFDGKTYSFTNGRTYDVDGWYSDGNGYKYYFKNGIPQKNTIIGNYYVDDTGRQITDSVVMKAVAFVNAHSSSSQTALQRFESCYRYMFGDGYHYQRISGVPSKQDVAGRADYYFTNKKGNCYCFATALAYVGKVLGFDSRVSYGKITSVHGGLTNHGWCSIKRDGTWYLSDYFAYMATDSSYPRYHTASDGVYTLKITNGTVSWE